MRYYEQPPLPQRKKSSAGCIVAIILMVVTVILGVMVVAGAVAFTAARSQQQALQARAMAEHERARQHSERLRAEMAEKRARELANQAIKKVESMETFMESPPKARKRGKEPIRVANREITISIDQKGKLKMDGKAVEPGRLKTSLANAGKGRESAISVTIKADKRCLFQHVASVLSICQELDVPNVRIAALE